MPGVAPGRSVHVVLVAPLYMRDAALAAVAAVALVVEGQLRAKGGITLGDALLAIAAAAPLAWRRQAPVAVLLFVEVGAVLCVLAFRASWSATAMVVVVLFTVAFLGDRRRSLALGAVTAAAVTGTIAIVDGYVDLAGVVPRLLLVVVALAVGDTVRSRADLRVAERERVVREAREREEEGRRRVAGERLRIARPRRAAGATRCRTPASWEPSRPRRGGGSASRAGRAGPWRRPA